MNGFMQSVKKLFVALGVVFVLLAAIGGYWYLEIYTKTPEYTLKMVQEAVENHDREKLEKYVATDHLLDAASDDMLEGLIQVLVPATGDTREAVSNLSRMFKNPVVTSLRSALDNYIAYGSWTNQPNDNEGIASPVDADMIVHRIGLPSIQFQKLDSMAVDKEQGTALAKVRVLQVDTNEELVLDVELCQQQDGLWQIYEIVNFKDFIEKLQDLRQKQVKAYLEESAQLMAQHDAIIAECQQRITAALAEGSLGNDSIRTKIKGIAEEQVADWQARKAELESMSVPEAAGSLHRLRLKICDARIKAAENYAKWMLDKKAATIRTSDNSAKMAKTLEKEADLLAKQVNSHVQ